MKNQAPEMKNRPSENGEQGEKAFQEGVDYYVDSRGRYVFTGHYLKRRGYCCGNGCRHCPWHTHNDIVCRRWEWTG